MSFLKSEAGAIVLWLAASLLGAALLTPHLYDAGKAFSASAEFSDYPGFLDSFAASAGRAQLDRYFSRALLLCAICLLPILILRIKKIPQSKNQDRFALRKMPLSDRLIHLASGLVIGAVVLGVLAVVLHFTGASQPVENPVSLARFFSKALIPAIGAGVIEELAFRGLLLGLWLRACSLWAAWIGSSVMFSFLHFLKPAPGIEIADPFAWSSGFEILGSMLGHFSNPLFFFTDFATLTLLGLMLAWCRTLTLSLWLPIGIHVGLVLALKTFSLTHHLNPDSSLRPWLIGSSLKSGILSLIAIGICFGLCVALVRHFLVKRAESLTA